MIPPHVHTPAPRTVEYTQEVLVVKRGRLRVDFYDEGRRYLESRDSGAGDMILLAIGGHGFEMLEDVEMIEVKQGPYAGEQDKQRFAGIAAEQVPDKDHGMSVGMNLPNHDPGKSSVAGWQRKKISQPVHRFGMDFFRGAICQAV